NDTAIASRAPVRQATFNLKQQDGLVAQSKFARLPTLTVSSTYQQIAFPNSFLPSGSDFVPDWNLVVRMDVPLFTGGRLTGDVKTAEANRQEARARLALAQKQATRELTNARSTLDGAYAMWEASQGTVEQAVRAYQIAEVRF